MTLSMTRRTTAMLLVLATILVAASPANAAHGELDPSFGEGGWVVTELGGSWSVFASAVAVQPDGKIVVAGTFLNRFSIVRYLPDGTLDVSFGDNGRVSTTFDEGPSGALALALQPDDKLVVAGWAGGHFYGGVVRMAVARYLVDGSLDPEFGGGDGRLVVPGRHSVAFAAYVAEDDGILLGGCRPCGYHRPGVRLIRLTPGGSLDPGFSGGGRVRVPTASRVDDFVFDAEGVLAVTHRPGRLTILRFGLDGALDASFGGDGIRSHPIRGIGEVRAAIDASGRIIVGMSRGNYRRAAVLRLTRTGRWDPSFSEDGIAPVDVALVRACAVLPDGGGNVLFGGSRWVGAGSLENDSVVARFDEAGAVDGSFGDQGIVEQQGPAGFELTTGCDDLAVQSDGKIVLVTSHVGSPGRTIMVARFMAP